MPEFDTYVDVDVDEFISACNRREIDEIIESLIDSGHISPSATKNVNNNIGFLEGLFIEKLDKLREKYYRISPEDEKILEDLFKKYL